MQKLGSPIEMQCDKFLEETTFGILMAKEFGSYYNIAIFLYFVLFNDSTDPFLASFLTYSLC